METRVIDLSGARRWGLTLLGTLVAALVLLVLGAQGAQAQETVTNDGCMEEVAGRNLGCTANDVSIAGVATDANGDPLLTILDDGCAFPGDEVTFEATFEVVLTAQERHDIGIYFATDGLDPEGDGAKSGAECSISTLAHTPDPPYLDLDGITDNYAGTKTESGIQDTCGDIDSDHNPLFPTIQITATCVDPDGNGTLNLPNCTSWRQPGSNELCTGPLPTGIDGEVGATSGVFPGAPSKCKCDDGFEVPIDVPSTIVVTKTAVPSAPDEPGADVTFTVDVENPLTSFASVTIQSLIDNVYGDLNDITDEGATAKVQLTACSPDLVGTSLAVGETMSCSFTANVSGDPGFSETDTVTVTATNDETGAEVVGEDNATVTIQDVPAVALTVVKSADFLTLPEPGGTFTFSAVITNPSTVDTATITVVSDTFGTPVCDESVLGPGESTNCTFSADHFGNFGDSWTNQVSVTATDDDGADVSAVSNEVTVSLTDVPAVALTVVKSADFLTLPEPGGTFTFSAVITNPSTVDTATITVVSDTYGTPECDESVLGPGESTNCTFSADHFGNAGDSWTNQVSVTATDDDGADVSAVSNEVTVSLTDVPPQAALTKTVTQMVVTYEVVITNDSVISDPLSIDSLTDDLFGDITDADNNLLVESTSCATGGAIDSGDSYTCQFDGIVTSSPHTNTVTGMVSDDDDPTTLTRTDSATVTFG